MAEPVSPELVLVDPALALRLRRDASAWAAYQYAEAPRPKPARAAHTLPAAEPAPRTADHRRLQRSFAIVGLAAALFAIQTKSLSTERGLGAASVTGLVRRAALPPSAPPRNEVASAHLASAPSPTPRKRAVTPPQRAAELALRRTLLPAAVRAGDVSPVVLAPHGGGLRSGTTIACLRREAAIYVCKIRPPSNGTIVVAVIRRGGSFAIVPFSR